MLPKYPIFIYQIKGSLIDFIQEHDPESFSRSTIMSMLKNENSDLIFESNGDLWEINYEYEKMEVSFLEKILAYTFYNPFIKSKTIWNKIRLYSLDELKEVICKCIDKDDDILTQFSEAHIFKEDVMNAQSFKEICVRYIWHMEDN